MIPNDIHFNCIIIEMIKFWYIWFRGRLNFYKMKCIYL